MNGRPTSGSHFGAPGSGSGPRGLAAYEVLGELSRAAGVVVYRARDRSLQRPVAIKVLGASAGAHEERRFAREAQALARLNHGGIVAIHEVGEEQGRAFLVLDLVEGDTLEDVLRTSGPLPAARVIDLGIELATAVQAAHEAGVLHRDLKPANVVLNAEGRALISNFGLTREVDPRARSSLSASGVILGTPGYLPPEQALGRHDQVGVASDVYGLGATLYALLTGRPPIQAPTLLEACAATLNEAPTPPSELVEGVPTQLEDVVLTCLEKTPQERYASAEEVREALRELKVALQRRVRKQRASKRIHTTPGTDQSRVALGVAGAVVVVLLLLLFVWSAGRRSGSEAALRAAEVARLEREKAELAKQLEERPSPPPAATPAETPEPPPAETPAPTPSETPEPTPSETPEPTPAEAPERIRPAPLGVPAERSDGPVGAPIPRGAQIPDWIAKDAYFHGLPSKRGPLEVKPRHMKGRYIMMYFMRRLERRAFEALQAKVNKGIRNRFHVVVVVPGREWSTVAEAARAGGLDLRRHDLHVVLDQGLRTHHVFGVQKHNLSMLFDLDGTRIDGEAGWVQEGLKKPIPR